MCSSTTVSHSLTTNDAGAALASRPCLETAGAALTSTSHPLDLHGRERPRSDLRRRTEEGDAPSSPEAGRRTSLWRAIGGSVRYDDAWRASSHRGAAVARGRRVGRSATELPRIEPAWFLDGDGHSEAFVDLQRDQTVADIEERARRRPHVGRAREAGDVHRYRDRSGTDERRPRGRDRESAARRRPRRAGTDERPPSGRAGLLRDDRRAAIAGTCSIRSAGRGSTRGTRSTAPCSRTSASGSDRGTSRADGEDMDAAVARECLAVRNAAGRARRLDPREDRGRSGPTPPRSSTGCTRTG